MALNGFNNTAVTYLGCVLNKNVLGEPWNYIMNRNNM